MHYICHICRCLCRGYVIKYVTFITRISGVFLLFTTIWSLFCLLFTWWQRKEEQMKECNFMHYDVHKDKKRKTHIHATYSWFHIKGTWSVHSFNGDYLSIPEGTGSRGYLFHEVPGSIWLYSWSSEKRLLSWLCAEGL